MFFNSITFVFFFAIVLGVYSLPLPWQWRKGFLLVASYAFYASFYPPHLLLLLVSTFVDFGVAEQMARQTDQRKRRLWLLLSLTSNLGMLGVFKYTAFVTRNLNALLTVAHSHYQIPVVEPLLPVGISFFTFEALSYTIDVYRRRMPPTRSLLDFAMFITFFPRMVAGPVMRAEMFLPQCEAPRRADAKQMSSGILLFLIGLALKVFVSDALLSETADQIFEASGPLSALQAWTGSLAFTSQIFCDFAGYSTCAIGLAHCLGFSLPENFDCPYAARGFNDFWARWHISLSTWLRDYLYFSFGTVDFFARRAWLMVMLTMTIGGLWHGASWTFVLWGAIHGVFLIAERLLRGVFRNAKGRLVTAASAIVTLLGVNVTWIVFRARSLKRMGEMMRALVGLSSGPSTITRLPIPAPLILAIFAVIVLMHHAFRGRPVVATIARWPVAAQVALVALCFFAIALGQGYHNAFLYFRF